MKNNEIDIMIIAGEVSGDFHSAKLAAEIKKRYSGINFFGVGGDMMRKAGVVLLHDLRDLAVLGAVEVIKHYPQIRKIFYEMLAVAIEKKPSAVILVDYPGFNIRFAKQLKKHNIPVIYYISPQIWAWGQHRKKVIAGCVDKMLAFFEFEKKFYSDTGLDVDFVGHPLIDTLKTEISREDFLNNNKLCSSKPVIGILPGSRKNEILKILPIMLKSVKIMHDHCPEMQFVLPEGESVPKDILRKVIAQSGIAGQAYIKTIKNQVHETMAHSDMVLVASGTATLETACFTTPMIIIYKVNFITSLIARMVIKIPYIGLVNVVAGKKIVPEFLQNGAKPAQIARCAIDLITNKDKLAQMKNDLYEVRKKLGSPGAVSRAAESVIKFLEKKVEKTLI